MTTANLSDLVLPVVTEPAPAAKSFWCIVALDYDKDEAWILDQSQDARDCDLLDGSSGDDNGLMQDWIKSATPGLYRLTLNPWGYQDWQGEWESGVDVSIVELLVAFPPRLCDDEGCPHYGTEHVCVSEKTSLATLHQRALTAAQAFEDAASYEETMWTGWGDCVVPPHAEMRRVKAQQAVCALRDAQKVESV